MSKNITEVSSKIQSRWSEKLEELDNEEGAEYLDFDICESIMITTLKEEMIIFIKEKYNPNKTTIELKDLFNFFNINGEDLLKDALNVGDEQNG